MLPRRKQRLMAVRERHFGLNAKEVHSIKKLKKSRRKLVILAALGMSLRSEAAKRVGRMSFVLAMLKTRALIRMSLYPANSLLTIDSTNKNITIDRYTDENCKKFFRFRRTSLLALFEKLNFPPTMRVTGSISWPSQHGFLVFLYLAHKGTNLSDVQEMFGRTYDQISRINVTTITWIYNNHRDLVQNNLGFYSDKLDRYAVSISRKLIADAKGPTPGIIPRIVDNICGFLDGTVLDIARPYRNNNIQNSFYSGYHRSHNLNYQAIVFPDGMICLSDAVPGCLTDIGAWQNSDLRQQIINNNDDREEAGSARLKLYADKIYHTSPDIQASFNNRYAHYITLNEKSVNRMMSSVRIGIEWTFGTHFEKWKTLLVKGSMQLQKCPIEELMVATALCTNAYNILEGSILLGAFQIEPPTLEEYFNQ